MTRKRDKIWTAIIATKQWFTKLFTSEADALVDDFGNNPPPEIGTQSYWGDIHDKGDWKLLASIPLQVIMKDLFFKMNVMLLNTITSLVEGLLKPNAYISKKQFILMCGHPLSWSSDRPDVFIWQISIELKCFSSLFLFSNHLIFNVLLTTLLEMLKSWFLVLIEGLLFEIFSLSVFVFGLSDVLIVCCL